MNYDFDAMTRDAVILDLVNTHGMSLNKATKEYVRLRKAAGFSVGVVSHKAEALAYLAEQGLTSPVNPKPLVADLVAEFDVKDDTAMSYIKAYAEEHGLEVKTRLASNDILEWIVEHAPYSEEHEGEWAEFDASFKEWMLAQGKSESNINEYRKGIKLHLMLINR